MALAQGPRPRPSHPPCTACGESGAKILGAAGWGSACVRGVVVAWWDGILGWAKIVTQWMVGWAGSKYLGWVNFRVVRVFRVPWPNTRTTRINFGYHGLEPELGFGFFGLGFFGFGFL